MLAKDDTRIQKLNGQSNFEVWKLRISAILVNKDLFKAVNYQNNVLTPIYPIIDKKAKLILVLSLKDRPLLQF